MRGRVIAAFVVGLAVGAFCIGAALWSTGKLQSAYLPPWVQRVPATPPAPAVPDTAAAPNLPANPVPPPEGAPSASGAADRSADRVATEPPAAASGTAATAPATLHPAPALHLAMPIAGIDPNQLTDTYTDARAGHRHEALDIAAPQGTPVMAVAEGNVAKLFTSKEGGLTVYQFDNTQQYAFYYAHLDRYAPGLKEGMLLRKGDTLGYVGTTGNAPKNAPHLHFAVFKLGPEKQWWKGTSLDPLPMFQ